MKYLSLIMIVSFICYFQACTNDRVADQIDDIEVREILHKNNIELDPRQVKKMNEIIKIFRKYELSIKDRVDVEEIDELLKKELALIEKEVSTIMLAKKYSDEYSKISSYWEPRMQKAINDGDTTELFELKKLLEQELDSLKNAMY